MQLKLMTPKQSIYDAGVQSVTIPGVVGQMEILPGHTHLLSLVQAGPLHFEDVEGIIQCFTVGEGHVEVTDDIITVAVERVTTVAES